MNQVERERLESELPKGWRIMAKLTQEKGQDGQPTHYHEVTMQAVSDTYNVVLEGSFPWIKKKATAYACSGRSDVVRND